MKEEKGRVIPAVAEVVVNEAGGLVIQLPADFVARLGLVDGQEVPVAAEAAPEPALEGCGR